MTSPESSSIRMMFLYLESWKKKPYRLYFSMSVQEGWSWILLNTKWGAQNSLLERVISPLGLEKVLEHVEELTLPRGKQKELQPYFSGLKSRCTLSIPDCAMLADLLRMVQSNLKFYPRPYQIFKHWKLVLWIAGVCTVGFGVQHNCHYFCLRPGTANTINIELFRLLSPSPPAAR